MDAVRPIPASKPRPAPVPRRPGDDQAFLLSLSDRLRPLADVATITREATRALGEYMGAARAGYAECAPDGDTVRIGPHYERGVPSMGGTYRLSEYGDGLADALRAGETVALSDLGSDPGLTEAQRAAYAGLELRSMADVPLVKDGRLVAILFVHFAEPHAWQREELLLLEDVAERTWAAVERGRAEADRREAIAGYERQVRLFEGVASTTPDFVYLFDLTGRFVYANRRLLEVWGVTLDEAVGRTPLELGYEQWHHDMHMREIAEVIEMRRPIKGEVPFKAPLTGIFGIYEYIFTPVIGPDGSVELIGGTTRDVTERKRIEEALQEREARLEEALAVKDEFLGLVSHELRTPLTIILGMSRILASAGPDSAERRSIAADIAESAEVLNDLVEAMLLLARLDSREAGQLREPVVLERAARTVVSRVAVRNPGHPLRLEVHTLGDVVEVQRTWIERVIENLVANAVKYSPPDAEVTVVVERADGGACVRVLDRGPGLDAVELERVFEPFYRTDSARTRAAGAGLGLAVARRIVELMDGRIWGRPREGGGSEFGFALPIARLD
jgi:PAS domain S-box-containing protein